MNMLNPTAGAVPPQIAPRPPSIDLQPLGENPAERERISNPMSAIDAILRQPRRVMYQLRQPGSGGLVGLMLVVTILSCAIYGVVMGSFSMGIQLWAAPVKLACGLLLSTLICLPSLYIFTCLSGSQARFGEICGLVAGLLMLLTLLLVGFAPVAWLFSQSTNSLVWMGVLHLLFWLIATYFGLRFLGSGFAHSHARSAAGLNTWIIIFMLVMVQMTTALRPLVGTAPTFLPTEKKFFVTYWGDCLNPGPQTAPKPVSPD
jgi:hypothetical protein